MPLSAETSAAFRPPAAPGFRELLDGFREELERELSNWLDARREEAGGAPERVELVDAVGRLATVGGKRLRPALVYYAYRACGGRDRRAVLPLALATEILHTYLLIHDDIMDRAEVRRGEPAAHARFREAHRERGLAGDAADFGRSVAILLGDLAHGWALELASSLPVEPARARDVVQRFSAMGQEVIGGQYLELLVAERRDASEEELLRVLRLKSGAYTAERPVQLGAALAGAPESVLVGLSRYGAAVGEAFQLQDDLLGMFGDPATMGKPSDGDLREGKYTFLIHHALSAASPAERDEIRSALGDRALPAGEVARVLGILEATGARRAVAGMIEERLAGAREALDGLDLEADGRTFLAGLIDDLRERER